ncbi:hypothetical protein STEG23_003235, partial [Scotinomys teguina]
MVMCQEDLDNDTLMESSVLYPKPQFCLFVCVQVDKSMVLNRVQHRHINARLTVIVKEQSRSPRDTNHTLHSNLQDQEGWAVVVHALNPSTQETEP